MRRFYSDNSVEKGNLLELSTDETRHLRDVLRLSVGDEVSVFDGNGREFRCVISEVDKRSARLEIIDEIEPVSPESPLELTIAATVLPGDKYDLIVQKCVELGVHNLIPMCTIRSEVKARDASRRVERWRRIAMEATKQCGRAKLMQVAEPSDFEPLISIASDVRVLFSERDGEAFSTLQTLPHRATIFYGPKGGWDDKELGLAREHGTQIVTFGGRILRAETAAIAITAVLQHRFGDMN